MRLTISKKLNKSSYIFSCQLDAENPFIVESQELLTCEALSAIFSYFAQTPIEIEFETLLLDIVFQIKIPEVSTDTFLVGVDTKDVSASDSEALKVVGEFISNVTKAMIEKIETLRLNTFTINF
jgi:hypothetical protein